MLYVIDTTNSQERHDDIGVSILRFDLFQPLVVHLTINEQMEGGLASF